MRARWRLLLDEGADGPWNMAVDEALLRAAQRGAPPALRFYRWQGAWLSLGYAQRLDPERRAACRQAGVGVVRRATGGRAVLHGADLTYAVAAPERALPAGLHATYALLCEALARGLGALGVAAGPAPAAAAPAAARDFDCFRSPALDALCVAGRKLAGSAQRRAGGGVLQHGSIRLAADPESACRAAGIEPGISTSLAELGFPLAVASVREACALAFAEVLGIELEPAALEAAERADALELAARHLAATDTCIPGGISREACAGR